MSETPLGTFIAAKIGLAVNNPITPIDKITIPVMNWFFLVIILFNNIYIILLFNIKDFVFVQIYRKMPNINIKHYTTLNLTP